MYYCYFFLGQWMYTQPIHITLQAFCFKFYRLKWSVYVLDYRLSLEKELPLPYIFLFVQLLFVEIIEIHRRQIREISEMLCKTKNFRTSADEHLHSLLLHMHLKLNNNICELNADVCILHYMHRVYNNICIKMGEYFKNVPYKVLMSKMSHREFEKYKG